MSGGAGAAGSSVVAGASRDPLAAGLRSAACLQIFLVLVVEVLVLAMLVLVL